MTNEEAKKMLEAKLECLKRETSGIDCNDGYNCDECELLYAQGNMGEQKEALDMAIKALEQESITWIVGKDNCQVAVRNMPIDKMQKICAIIGDEEQQPKTGHWIEVTNGRGGHECDLCHEYAPSYKSGDEYLSKYCPNCGAKMEVEE